MLISKSQHLTYCFGVKKAIDMALNTVDTENEPVFMLGDIVHNKYAVKMLEEKGLNVVSDINEIPNNSIMIIRSHGTTADIYKKAQEKGLTVIDATCVIVLKNQKLVEKLENEGYTIILIGDRHHDEVKSIISFAKHPIVVSSSEEIYEQKDNLKKIAVILQTTEIIHSVKDLVGELSLYASEMYFFNTICPPSKIKQDEVIKLANENDVVYIIGSETSKNTKNLYLLAKKYNNEVHFIENQEMISLNKIERISKIGIAAGTSTPMEIIDGVINRLESIYNDGTT